MIQVAEEPAVWYLISTLAKVALFYKELGTYHGDIQPWTVHINPDDEVMLMDNPLLFPKSRDNLSKALANPAYTAALSPLQLQSLARKERFFSHHPQASEIWSIGMTSLSFSSLKDLNYFYDWSRKQVRFDLIHEEIQKLSDMGYSRNLVNLLGHMLSFNEEKRPNLELIRSCASTRLTQNTLAFKKVMDIPAKLIDSYEFNTPL